MKAKQKAGVFAVLDFYLRRGKTAENFLRIFHSEDSLDKELSIFLKDLGVTESMLLQNKDTMKGHLQTLERNKKGEYYTPLEWAQESLTYLDEYIPNWKEDYYFWDAASGTGNLLNALDIPKDRIFASTLEFDDVALLKEQNYNAFQLDFLNGINYDEHNMHFEENLPTDLVTILKEDKPIIFYMNPPYKYNKGGETDISNVMLGMGLGSAAQELYYQFLYRINDIIQTYNLTNAYVGVFGLTGYHVGVSLEAFAEHLHSYLTILGGMLIPSDVFLDLNSKTRWPIGFTLYKRGASDRATSIVYDVKDTDNKGAIVLVAKEEFLLGRQLLKDWVQPEDVQDYKYKQLSANPPELIDEVGEKYATNAIGALVLENRAGNLGQKTMVSTVPLTTGNNIPVTSENLMRCAGAFTVQTVLKTKWASHYKYFYAPELDTSDLQIQADYEEWNNNALVFFLTYRKSVGISLSADLDKGVLQEISNTLFPFTPTQIRDNLLVYRPTEFPIVTDLLESIPETPQNELITSTLTNLLVSNQLWKESIDILDSYLTLVTTPDYRTEETTRWDMGLRQLQTNIDPDVLNAHRKLVLTLRDKLQYGVEKFKFL